MDTARSPSSSDLATELIRTAILDGTLGAGERLKEDELAGRLDISRTPVREALRQLAAEDLVVLEQNRGARVRDYGAEELDDLYRLRAVLEGYAAGRAAERIRPTELAELRESCERFATLAGRKRPKPAALAEENRRFHDSVLEAARDPRLSAMAHAVIRLPLVYKAYIWFTPEQREASARYHRKILKALEKRDAERAAEVMADHVYGARGALLKALEAESA